MKNLTAFVVTSLASAPAFAGGNFYEPEPINWGGLIAVGVGTLLCFVVIALVSKYLTE